MPLTLKPSRPSGALTLDRVNIIDKKKDRLRRGIKRKPSFSAADSVTDS